MILPYVHHGDIRHHSHHIPPPNWFTRDFDDAPINKIPEPVKIRFRLKVPVWPGFRLAILIEETT